MYFGFAATSEFPIGYHLPMALREMDPQELQHALQGLALGDEAAYTGIYEHYWHQIYHFSRTLTRDDATAQDVAQQVFYDLLVKQINFLGQSKFSSYLCRIAINKAADLGRKSSDRPNHVNIDDPGEYPDTADESRTSNPELAMEDRQTDASYRRCLDKLPSHQKVVLACYSQQMTETEIAKVIECAIGTVKSRLSTARASMRKCLEPWRREVQRA
jgi:RNA polymerase sigma-70 factor (ECF subfamily)